MTLNNTRRNQKLQLETRQASLFQQIYNKFDDPEFIKNEAQAMSFDFHDIDDWFSKYSSHVNMDAYSQWMSVNRFYHGVGVLVDRGLVDVRLVNELMGDHVIEAWEKVRTVTIPARERFDNPNHGLAFENLYNKLRELKT
jgi:hypothetical protein